jgi:hypothetical protein
MVAKVGAFLILACCLLPAQNGASGDTSNMSVMDHASSAPANGSTAGAEHAMHVMESRHMDMGRHMKMSHKRALQPGDQERADYVIAAARKAMERYRDYRAALDDGYHIFLPNVSQPMYHFTNRRFAFEAAFHLNPEHPTSLLYEKHGSDYKLIGVMYTAPKRLSEDQLDSRIPLSIAQWHEHVNLCLPPQGRREEMSQVHARFGLRGSIATEQECTAAGGRFLPQVFGWMVHVYPMESTQQAIWSVERQRGSAD